MLMPTTIALCAILVAFAGQPQDQSREVPTIASPTSMQASDWANNGAAACTKLLTAGFLNAILVHPAGKSEVQDGQSCAFSADSGETTIKIELADHLTLDAWKAYNKVDRPTAIALAGVGDQALRVENPVVIDAWKTGGRNCRVMLLAIVEQPKLTGEALAKKLGGTCNQLFALP
jgi:hypothetical protein